MALATQPLRYWFWWPARTLDTFEADTPPVMQLARNIYAPLVSDFVDGKAVGMVAEKWSVDESGRKWRFTIRKNLFFEDKTPITPLVVVQNFKRILWLTRGEGLVLNSLLPEVNLWSDYNVPLKSISVDGDDVVFSFNKRPISLFEAISQPIYGIADPKCFDENGKWKEPFSGNESGQYRILKREGTKFTLKSRHVFPQVDNAPEYVEINFPEKNGEDVVSALVEGRGDLTVEHSFALSSKTLAKLADHKLQILEEPPVRMHFVHLNSKVKGLNDKRLRQSIRDRFLKRLSSDSRVVESKIEVNASFIPRGGVGYKDYTIGGAQVLARGHGEDVAVLFFPIAGEQSTQSAIEEAVLLTLKEHNLNPKVERFTDRFIPFKRMREGDFGVIVRGTGILTNNPYADLRMMFLSKVGALIPDESGKIPKLIERAEVESSPQKRWEIVGMINDTLFDTASIVTFAHSRLLYIHAEGVSLQHINVFSDPIEFRAVGWSTQQ